MSLKNRLISLVHKFTNLVTKINNKIWELKTYSNTINYFIENNKYCKILSR